MARRTDPDLAHRPLRHRAAHRTIHTLRRREEATKVTLAFESLLQATANELAS